MALVWTLVLTLASGSEPWVLASRLVCEPQAPRDPLLKRGSRGGDAEAKGIRSRELHLARQMVSGPVASRPFFRKNGYRRVPSPSRTATKLGRIRPLLPAGRPTKFRGRRCGAKPSSRRLGTSDHVILPWPGHRVPRDYSCTGSIRVSIP